jgi:enoyl-CoA hydratase
MIQAKYVKMEQLDRVLRLTIDRAEAMNAANSELLNELIESMADASANQETRAVILTGAGDRAFVAGADIKEMSGMSPLQAREYSHQGHRLTQMIEEMEKPVIAALNGAALGGGCEIALACDMRIASDRAKLGQPEVKLGIIPGWGGTFRLARLVGEGMARELILTGRVVSAEEALRIGLVNAVVPPERVAEEALKVAAGIADAGPLAVAFAKRSMHLARSLDAASAAELEEDLFSLAFTTGDGREGLAAFLEKRPAVFRGHQ